MDSKLSTVLQKLTGLENPPDLKALRAELDQLRAQNEELQRSQVDSKRYATLALQLKIAKETERHY